MSTLSAIGSSFLVVLGMTTVVGAQAGCPAGGPCIVTLGLTKSGALVANIANTSGQDVINLRWSRPGRVGAQKEYRAVDSRFPVLASTTPRVTYTVAVQGCKKRTLQSSICSNWDHKSITAK